MSPISSSTVPETTHAVQVSKIGGPEVIEFVEISTPIPKPDELLIKIEYAGVNYIDTYHRSGLYQVPLPFTLGREASGIVVKLPTAPEVLQNEAFKKRGLKAGNRVAVFANVQGLFKGYATSPWDRVARLPEGLSGKSGASLLQGLTALTNLKESYEVKKGDWILIHAVAGGLGLQLCQIAKILGAKIIGTTSTPEKAEIAKQHGADHVILYTKESVVEAVKKITSGVGVAAVYDGVGKDTWEDNFELIARKGTIVSIGNASGAVPPFAPLKLSAKNLKVTRPVYVRFPFPQKLEVFVDERSQLKTHATTIAALHSVMNSLATPEEFDYYTQEYFRLVNEEGVKFLIHKEYPFSAEGVRQSQMDITGRGTVGKLLISIGNAEQ